MKKILVTDDGERLIETPANPDIRSIGGRWLLVCNGNQVTRLARAGAAIRVNGKPVDFQLADPRDRRRGDTSGDASGRKELRAAMPGKVVQILATAGQEVAAGQGILTLEAMKMQNEVRAPRAGRVAAIHVQPGATVAAGQTLATLE